MQVLPLDTLPDFARRELVDFYQFLLQKYAVDAKSAETIKQPIAPRLVKPFEPLKRSEL